MVKRCPAKVGSMNIPYVSLYDHVGTGVIIEHPTGVAYSNQAGGTACLHPSIEGAFVPFRNYVQFDDLRFWSPDNDLREYFEGPKHRGTGATSGLDEDDADFIDNVLTQAHVDHWLQVDRGRLKESCEAWVFVTVSRDYGDADTGISSGFGPYPKLGVLTWGNSD